MTNNSSEFNKNSDSGFNKNMTTTDTPRTDSCPHCGCQTKDPFGMGKTIHNVENCKRNRQLAELQQQKRNCIEIIDDDAKERSELKAEVERLTGRVKELESVLRRVINTPVIDPAKLIDFSMAQLWDSIADAKNILNPTDK